MDETACAPFRLLTGDLIGPLPPKVPRPHVMVTTEQPPASSSRATRQRRVDLEKILAEAQASTATAARDTCHRSNSARRRCAPAVFVFAPCRIPRAPRHVLRGRGGRRSWAGRSPCAGDPGPCGSGGDRFRGSRRLAIVGGAACRAQRRRERCRSREIRSHDRAIPGVAASARTFAGGGVARRGRVPAGLAAGK